MDVDQIRRLEPSSPSTLISHDCFDRKDTRGTWACTSGANSDLPEKSVEPIALDADVPPRACRSFSASTAGDEDRLRDRSINSSPLSIGSPYHWNLRRNQRPEGRQDARRAKAMVWSTRQDRELHRYRPLELRT